MVPTSKYDTLHINLHFQICMYQTIIWFWTESKIFGALSYLKHD